MAFIWFKMTDEQSVIKEGHKLDFLNRFVSYFKGDIGQPVNGFNKELQDVILKFKTTNRTSGEYLDPVNFDEIRQELGKRLW